MSTNKKGFHKGNKYRYVTDRKNSLTTTLTLRISPEQKELIKNVPNWQEQLRSCIDSMIEGIDGVHEV
ncbi:MAG: hypothetical protein ACFB2X_19030 [Rivularia sp. (in: cyanobacteria)]